MNIYLVKIATKGCCKCDECYQQQQVIGACLYFPDQIKVFKRYNYT